jgi:hypothetical protein
MVTVSIAVIGYFRRDTRGVGLGSRLIAPVVSGVALFVIFVLIIVNFDVLLGQTETNATTFILPAVVIVPGIVGVFWAYRIRSRRPDVYRQIGHGTDQTQLLGADGELGTASTDRPGAAR